MITHTFFPYHSPPLSLPEFAEEVKEYPILELWKDTVNQDLMRGCYWKVTRAIAARSIEPDTWLKVIKLKFTRSSSGDIVSETVTLEDRTNGFQTHVRKYFGIDIEPEFID
jgi:hypothetical protein